MPDPRQHVAVALSGGGHRASVFTLGSLLYLVDAGKGPEISSVSSISGGSLTNGYVGLTTDLTTVSPQEFRTAVKPLAVATSTGGTIWVRPATYVFLISLVVTIAAAVALSFVLDGWWILLTWVVALLLLGWIARRRSWVARSAFDSVLFKKARLSQMNQKVDHVITSCDLQTCEQVFFSGRFVYTFRHGWGTPGDLKVGWAAQASACLPGAFIPVSRATSKHHFVEPSKDAPANFLLVDGGVYDNMGTEWGINVAQRLRKPGCPQPPPNDPDEIIVVNASAAQGVVKRNSSRTPLLGEITSLLADKDVLYDQTTAVRRRLLDARYRVHRLDPTAREALNGTTIQIDRSPFELADAFRGDPATPPSDDLGRRAAAVLAALGDTAESRKQWDEWAHASRSVGTALSKIKPDVAANMLRHAYVLTMANAHVLLNYPLLDIPDVAHFRALVVKG